MALKSIATIGRIPADVTQGTFPGNAALSVASPAVTSWVDTRGWNGVIFIFNGLGITAGTVTLEEADDSSGTNSQTATDEDRNPAVHTLVSGQVRGGFAIDVKALSKPWIRLNMIYTGAGVAATPVLLDAAQVEAGFGDDWDVRIRTKDSDL